MLELRPNCELCDKDLGPHAPDAMICTYECTYCADCVSKILRNVCPKCGGNFEKRPVRPVKAWREEFKLGLENHPPSTRRFHNKFSRNNIETHVERIEHLAPKDR